MGDVARQYIATIGLGMGAEGGTTAIQQHLALYNRAAHFGEGLLHKVLRFFQSVTQDHVGVARFPKGLHFLF